MVGSDTRLFSKHIKLRVVTVDGYIWSNEFAPETTMTNVKIMSIGHLIGSDDAEKSFTRYTLLNTRTSSALRDEQTLIDAFVKDGDELLLFPKRTVGQSSTSGAQTARHSQLGANSLGVASATSSTSAASSLRASLSDSDSELLREVIATLNNAASTTGGLSLAHNIGSPTPSASTSTNVQVNVAAAATGNVQLLVNNASAPFSTPAGVYGIPDARTIAEVTANIEPRNLERLAAHTAELEATRQNDFNRDIQAISITLIELAQKLLCTDPNATRIYKQVEEFIRQRAVADSVTDRALTKQLVEMGFPEPRVREALQICGSSFQAAMEYLIEHAGENEQSASTGEKTTETSIDRPDDAGSICGASSASASASAAGGVGSAARCVAGGDSKTSGSWNILELYRKYRYQQFRVNSKAKESLVSMGFEEGDVVDTLRACNNDQQTALEILLDDNRAARIAALRNANASANTASDVASPGSSFAAFGGGPPVTALDPSSSLHRAIVANPTIQLGLTNPRSLIALLQILENPTQTMLWLNDPDTAPMLIALSRIYHAEKHATKSTSASLS